MWEGSMVADDRNPGMSCTHPGEKAQKNLVPMAAHARRMQGLQDARTAHVRPIFTSGKSPLRVFTPHYRKIINIVLDNQRMC